MNECVCVFFPSTAPLFFQKESSRSHNGGKLEHAGQRGHVIPAPYNSANGTRERARKEVAVLKL